VGQHPLAREDVAEVEQGLVLLDPAGGRELALLFLGDNLRLRLPAVPQASVGSAIELRLIELAPFLEAGERFPSPGIGEHLGVGGNAHQGIRATIIVVDAAVLAEESVPTGMLARVGGQVQGKLGPLPEGAGFRVELDQPALIRLHGRANLHVVCEHPLLPLAVAKDDEARDPGRAWPGHLAGGAGKSVLVDEVAQVDSPGRIEPALAGEIRSRAGHVDLISIRADPPGSVASATPGLPNPSLGYS